MAAQERKPQPFSPTEFAYEFPDPSGAEPYGLIGYGADFAPATVVAAYLQGIFPWPHGDEEYLWFSPDPRAIIPVGGLHISRRLARTIRQGRFRVTMDRAFRDVMTACADRPEGTWITPALIEGYCQLNERGWAHSIEVWDVDGALAGGLYGVRVGNLFGAESMFHRVTDASKVAMAAMMEWAEATGIEVVDVQVLSPHTEAMGAIELARDDYLAMARHAMAGLHDYD
ncbi:MAG: leucyl/phenylalanyl-tRNA--protein transferase [Chloroflexi bacterium]|nr:leucyl/phenylalanyl-tRNA--protein transferase [Chloroflexota bacterium]